MANKAISELPEALNVNNQDLFVLEQGGLAKKLPAETFITEQGIINALAEALDGHGGISSVTLSSVSGRIRTYRITFTDQSATTFQVYDGTSIDRISRTSSSGLDDVYTIFLSDGTTTFFTVHNGADGTVSEAMLNDALKDKAPAVTETTESSAIANFTDGADDMVMHNVVAEINPVQDLTYGDPYPAGGGKNKLPYPYYGTSGTIDGITYTVNADGTILLNGTASARSVFYLSNHVTNFAPPSGSYILSKASTSNQPNLIIDAYNGNSWVKQITNSATNDSVAFTLDYDGYDRIEAFLSVSSGQTVSNKLVKPMIRLSSVSDDTFAPYSNICPITGHTEVNVTRTGKNLCSSAIGRYLWASGVRYANNGKYCAFEDKVAVKGGEQIAVSFTDAGTCSSVYFAFFNGETYISQFIKWGAPWIASVPDNANMVALSFTNNVDYTTSPVISNVMLTYGSTALAYEPYQGTSLTVDWSTEAGTVYGGTIDVATGLLTVDRAMVDMGTLNWTKSSVSRDNAMFVSTDLQSVIKAPPSTQDVTDAVSSVYAPTTAINALSTNNTNGTFAVNTHKTNPSANGQLYVVDNAYADATAFKTAVTGQTICYELAIPQTYQLSGQQLMTLLGTNNVWADTGNVSVTYAADTKLYIEKLTMPTEDDMVANQAITSGKYFMVGNSLYLALANIASGAQITIGTNAQRVSLADALNTINA